jgi:hypothetical protein
MSQKFNELVRCYLEHWPNLENISIYQNGRVRAKIKDNFLCTYETEILRITEKAIWVNNHSYSLTSNRDKSALYTLLMQYGKLFPDKQVIIIDFEMLKRLPEVIFLEDFIDNVEICDMEEDKIILNDNDEYVIGWYYVFKFKDTIYYAYMREWPDRKSARLQFICELPGKWVKKLSVNQAREVLKPRLIKKEWIEGKDYYRQGDLFFIPHWFKPKIQKAFCKYKYEQRNEISLMTNRIKKFNLGRHVLSEACLEVDIFGLIHDEVSDFRNCQIKVFAKGCVHHPEHGRLKLGDGKTWFLVQKNTAVRSIGFEGRND